MTSLGKDVDCDVIVIGAGHAGCEAAHAASSLGLETCLITADLNKIAQMPCNPAIGGLAKGHLVREIDALGGIMGFQADKTGIQFRLLNSSRGGAVQAPRAQSDKALYRKDMTKFLRSAPKLHLVEGMVTQILKSGNSAIGVKTHNGEKLLGKAVILTPGTFLNGLIHIGLENHSAGRDGEPASLELSNNLVKMGLRLFRLKTGTPMRLQKDTIDWSQFKPHPGDQNPVPFSFRTKNPLENKILCHIGYTNPKTHEVINNNLDKSPLFSGIITGIGPRYCPSIEDKVVKFPHHRRHQFFLEPEGLDTQEIYVNGLSSSLSLETQTLILKSVPGLDLAKILRPAYGIEYDAVDSTLLSGTLETRTIPNLYLAGQINGTSGYEEAAAQGLMAGINAALKILKKKPLILGRSEAYIGVLIDDLISLGVEEPYRLFTSRAEHRLHLRIDNADKRLMPYGHNLGLIEEETFSEFKKKQQRISKAMACLEENKIQTKNQETLSLKKELKKPHVSFQEMTKLMNLDFALTQEEIRNIESEIKYEGYIKKQDREIAKFIKIDREKIPKNILFEDISGFTGEVIEKLQRIRPKTIGDAKKISGMTPAAIVNLHIHIKLLQKKKKRTGVRPSKHD
ncbi:tRNA uridine-5-carboxymethylaminomethyl(34) synthesis enzyme MnmG [Acidobacteriota bacterium]